jgi:3-mercaptopyruvate sulfurtransferase SseA
MLSDSMSMTGKSHLVTVGEALKVFEEPSVVFVDGSWFLSGRNGRAEYETGPRIQGAVYFDIDDVASKGDLLNPRNIKHMMPPKRLFAAAMDAMGIQNSNHLIVYGTQGCVSQCACTMSSSPSPPRNSATKLKRLHL